MTIEVHTPELETLIQERMASGRYADVEDVLLDALRTFSRGANASDCAPRQSFAQFMKESPLYKSGLEFERQQDEGPRKVDFDSVSD